MASTDTSSAACRRSSRICCTKAWCPHGIPYSALIRAGAKDDKAARALELAQAMRDQGLVPNVITYSALISAFARGDKAARALELFQETWQQGMVPDLITYSALISAFAKGDKAVMALEIVQKRLDQGPVPERYPLQCLDQSRRTGQLTALQQLGLDGHQLSSLPESMGQLPAARR